jgi:hypothetical protein
MSKGQRGNKEAKKPKKDRGAMAQVPPLDVPAAPRAIPTPKPGKR